ncbi:MAG TPA: hypothetical protein VE843_05435, partial [Ktedonobacteraceae bacterium]|nr:hypothetical protein [Ktedonobacteraceae bacterium]
MYRSHELLSKAQITYRTAPSSLEFNQDTLHERANTPDIARFLITLDKGIGDALLVGLSAVDQIILNDPMAYGKIDVLCNPLQAQIFTYDPRINEVIQTDTMFACGPQVTEWLRGISLDSESLRIVHYLQSRGYEAVLPTIVAPGLYLRLHSHLMYPDLFKIAKHLLLHGAPADIPVRIFVRQMVNKYFCNVVSDSELHDDVVLYLDAQHIRRA